jgi:hypothetical protein
MTHTLTDSDVRYSHLVDDTEKMRTKALRDSNRAAELLDDALHAVQHGSYATAAEFIERAREFTDKARSTLGTRPE